MPRALAYRRAPRHRLLFHRPPRRPPASPADLRTSDLVLALLAVAAQG